ncbi:MAG TPA: HAMP domain-containing sensor histidine kinase [Armatimonadota bacterium]|nr:HAMP domain-containing sensor histidine kinase [Armatimonadota bacterium]
MIRMKSLRARMTVAVTAAFAVWTFLVCIGLQGYTGHNASRQADCVLDATVNILYRDVRDNGQDESDAPGQRTGHAITAAVLSDFLNEHHDDLAANHVSAFLVNGQGQILQRTGGHLPPWPLVRHDDDWRIRTISSGNSTLVLDYDWGKTEDDLHEQAVMLLAFSLCVVIAAAGATWVLVGRTLSPIGRLAQQASAASTDTLQLHLDTPSQDVEMVELVATLNDLLARLGETVAAKGRFYAAASHELRTPLQALSGHLEVALSRQRPADEYRATLEEAHAQTRRLTILVRDLLILNQLDTATMPPLCETMSIAEICDRALRLCQPLVAQHDLHLHTALEQDGEISVPPTHAEMLIRNLVENAVKYATPGGEVRVELKELPNLITVTISNSCAPIANWDANALFEPFYRLDASRNAKTGGNGLGLAICKAIAIANGWQITLDHNGTGVTAIVCLIRHVEVE